MLFANQDNIITNLGHLAPKFKIELVFAFSQLYHAWSNDDFLAFTKCR